MRELEDAAEECGITRIELMENAGRGTAEIIEKEFPELKEKKILIICGSGNNGGDGFVIARYLYDLCKVHVLFLGEESLLSNEASVNFQQLKDLDKDIIFPYNEETAPLVTIDKYDIVVDAMLGTGAKGALQFPYSILVRDINFYKPYVISVDIPTGINPDTGEFYENLYVKPNIIVTFHDVKPGLKKFKNIKVVDIGVPFPE
jgi:NAD(P)H-hydrate epimerase